MFCVQVLLYINEQISCIIQKHTLLIIKKYIKTYVKHLFYIAIIIVVLYYLVDYEIILNISGKQLILNIETFTCQICI